MVSTVAICREAWGGRPPLIDVVVEDVFINTNNNISRFVVVVVVVKICFPPSLVFFVVQAMIPGRRGDEFAA